MAIAAATGAHAAAVSQLREVDEGKLGKIVRCANVLVCLLSLALAGVLHVLEIITCSCLTDDPDDVGEVCECMDFFEGLSNFFIATYIM